MKTLEIKNVLKKDLMIVELAQLEYYEVFKEGIYIKDHESGGCDFIKGSYTLLGKPDEISEEDAKELIPIKSNDNFYPDYSKYYENAGYFIRFKAATESLMSALETQVYWENPIDIKGQTFSEEHQNIWQEYESRTFDRSRTLIFVKS